MVDNTCSARRKDGEPCRGRPTRSGRCPSHDASLADRVKEARRAGGHGKSRSARAAKLLPDDLQVLDRILDEAIQSILDGALLPAQGGSVASLVNAKVKLREIALKIAEQTTLTERVSRLEEMFNDPKRPYIPNGTGRRLRR
jgi:hypothetical protein